ncbi:MAG: hypothetical protein KGS72_26780 [Cyanobacteria bacterium REEB67]|nr:hypothetical protein [Cyanobacteria bacterium REEB67]
MSIFSGGFNPVPWLREKTVSALQYAVTLIDLANEPDTTIWYKRKLTNIAEGQLSVLVPIVALVHDAGADAADYEQWKHMLDGGSFALGTWCKKWKIADPRGVAVGSLLEVRTHDEIEEKSEESLPAGFDGDAVELRLEIYRSMTRRLLSEDLSDSAKRLLLWLLSHLWINEPPDVVTISRKFLPTDIGVNPEEASEAYRQLYELELIEMLNKQNREDGQDRLSVRLIVQGINDSRHPLEFQEVKFGFPGARVAGKLTSGQGFFVRLPDTLSATLGWWFKEKQELPELRDELQERIGEDTIYVEQAEIQMREDKPIIFVQFRYPLDAELELLEKQLTKFAREWVEQKLVRY